MKTIYGLDGVAYNRDISIIKKEFPLIRGWRSNWCRRFPIKGYDLKLQVESIKEWLSTYDDSEYIEVLVDRQHDRMALAKMILEWDTVSIDRYIIDELHEFVKVLPNDYRIIGELYNGDEFGPGCGFPWDPLKILNRPVSQTELSAIKYRFNVALPQYIIDKVWKHRRLIIYSTHYYMYPNGKTSNRSLSSFSNKNITECGIHYDFWNNPAAFIKFILKLHSLSPRRLYYHEIFPGIPGNPTAKETAHDLDRFTKFMQQNKYDWSKDFSYNGAALNQHMLSLFRGLYSDQF